MCFFLFEMGLELSLGRLKALRRELGLGAAQVAATSIILAKLATPALRLTTTSQAAVVGSALALSSSAFALRLLRDRDDLATAHGRAALGVLLAQNLAVVPLLAAIPGLAGRSAVEGTVGKAVAAAAAKGLIALATVELVGKHVMNSLFFMSAQTKSQEAFFAVVLLNVLGIASVTEAAGLPAALGALLAGASSLKTRYRYQVEADVAPFRGVLLGLFFADGRFLRGLWRRRGEAESCSGGDAGSRGGKSCGSGPARALLPAAGGGGGAHRATVGACGRVWIRRGGAREGFQGARRFDRSTIDDGGGSVDVPHAGPSGAWGSTWPSPWTGWRPRGCDGRRARDDAAVGRAVKNAQGELVVVVGYGGRVGRVVCELLDAKLQRYVVFDLDPHKATDARQRGKPVFFGDLGRPEVLEYFGVGAARLVVVAVADKRATNRVVVAH